MLVLEIHKRVLHSGFAPPTASCRIPSKQQRCARPVTLYAHSSALLKVTHCQPSRSITAFFVNAISEYL